jgi:hypothetical protein
MAARPCEALADNSVFATSSATCLGQPAQAIVGTTQDAVSLASVTLAPRKTSLWTSAISSSVIALGCDKKVLTTADPSRPQMEAYVTGGKHGDGAVFALDLGEVRLGLPCLAYEESGSETDDRRFVNCRIWSMLARGRAR